MPYTHIYKEHVSEIPPPILLTWCTLYGILVYIRRLRALPDYTCDLCDKWGKDHILAKKRRIQHRKKSLVGWISPDWVLKRTGIAIVHTLPWLRQGPHDKHTGKKVKIRITIEEI